MKDQIEEFLKISKMVSEDMGDDLGDLALILNNSELEQMANNPDQVT